MSERHYQRICRWVGVELTQWQHWACQFLEDHGLKFGVDFGHQNCEQKAEDITASNGKWWLQ